MCTGTGSMIGSKGRIDAAERYFRFREQGSIKAHGFPYGPPRPCEQACHLDFVGHEMRDEHDAANEAHVVTLFFVEGRELQ